MNYSAPIQRIGTPFQKPAWRFEAITNPLKYGFSGFCTSPKSDCHSLNRVATRGYAHHIVRKYPLYFEQLSKTLPAELNEQLIKIWKKNLRQHYSKDLYLNDFGKCGKILNWNIPKLKELQDIWLKKLVFHAFGNKQYSEITFALALHGDELFEQQFRYIGLEIFANESDINIGKRWKIPVNNITAIRNLFYDFSYFPVSRVAQWSLLVQLLNNDDIADEDFALYKRVYELGHLGVKAQVDGYHLDSNERQLISEYLAKSAMKNTFDIQFAIKTNKDAKDYNNVLSAMANLNNEKEGLRLKCKQYELADFALRKQMRDDGETAQASVRPADLELLSEALIELTAKDSTPKYREYIDIAQLK